VTGEYGAGGRT